jgi:hypothetical protein
VGDLADGRRALADGGGDLVVAHAERLAQDEDGAFGRRQRLQHEHQRHRHALRELDVIRHVRGGEQRLRQPLADVRLSAPLHRAQPVERLPAGDPHQVGALVAHLRTVDLDPPQPGLLQDVLGVGRRSQHLVRHREQQIAVGEERLGRRVDGVVTHTLASSSCCRLSFLSHRCERRRAASGGWPP